eukprot:198499-Prymnesium_polylepis.2
MPTMNSSAVDRARVANAKRHPNSAETPPLLAKIQASFRKSLEAIGLVDDDDQYLSSVAVEPNNPIGRATLGMQRSVSNVIKRYPRVAVSSALLRPKPWSLKLFGEKLKVPRARPQHNSHRSLHREHNSTLSCDGRHHTVCCRRGSSSSSRWRRETLSSTSASAPRASTC